MNNQPPGKKIVNDLVRQAHVFPIKDSAWNWIRGVRIGTQTSSLLSGAGINPITKGIEKLMKPSARFAKPLLGSTGGAALGGALAGGGSFMAIMAGLSDIGRASHEGKAIGAARMMVGTYVNKFAEILAGYAVSGSSYKARATAKLDALKGWENKAIGDVHRALKKLDSRQGSTVLSYLKDTYGNQNAIADALRGMLRTHSVQHATPKLRQMLFPGAKAGTKAQPGPQKVSRPAPSVRPSLGKTGTKPSLPRHTPVTKIDFKQPSVVTVPVSKINIKKPSVVTVPRIGNLRLPGGKPLKKVLSVPGVGAKVNLNRVKPKPVPRPKFR